MSLKEQVVLPTLEQRRRFLKFAVMGGAVAALPEGVALGDHADLRRPGSRGFWRRLKKSFLLDRDFVYMNIGTTGSTPRAVLDSYDAYNRLVASDPWSMGGEWGTFPYTSDLVARVAPQFGAAGHEIVLSRNTTDGMCSVIEGLNLQSGDEVLYSHHEHVAAESPLYVMQQRHGVKLVPVEIPVLDATEDAYVDAFARAVTPDTRLIVFSHITYKTGARLPAKRICKEVAVPNRIPTLIDGAHAVGMVNLDFHDIDCDFYAGSGHKWQCGPGATGILYVRDNLERVRAFWSDRSDVFWPVNSSLAEFPFFGIQVQMQYVGNDNYPAKRALADVCDLWDEIGRERIEQRVLDLSAYCKQLLTEGFGDSLVLYSPSERGLSSGITACNPFPDQTDITTLDTFRDRLRDEYGYIVRTTDFKLSLDDPFEVHGLRISTHLFHTERDVEGLVESMLDLYARMMRG